ncbi:hypothetical protein PMZ80_007015 [Knufia obscura]|uniref:Uncharacterized protein n=2 Tax=Knufia TaxID=430999 RepID=A0AAN8FFG3_9EURO|nr:hypothetical protein PMZ80_007015 [Knufia obscura]KAK5957551.1 hypothetical protein OHC33_001927 [Knufia fluminis]
MSQPNAQQAQPRRRSILEEPARREAMPQNSQCPDEEDERGCGRHGANIGHAVPFGQMLSYGPNGSPTITITKTLFSAAEVTSTRTTGSSSSASSGTPALSTDPTVSAFIGVTQANNVDTGSTTIATTTGTSTIFNSRTITGTRSTSSSTSSNTSDFLSSTDSSKGTQTKSAAAVSSTAASNDPPAQQPGVVAGSVIGSMAAFSMIGILIWYFCVKKQGKQKLKMKLNLRRRKSSDVKTPQLEGQSLEGTRTIMLQQAELNKSRENDLNSFLAAPTNANQDQQHNQYQEQYDNARSIDAPMESAKTRPSWIGLAMSSSTPPNTPPMPRSNSQKSTAPSVGHPSSHPSTLTPGMGSGRTSVSSSLMPAPLKTAMRPAPIITSPRLDRPDNVSPLSPRGMFNAMSNTTKGAWRRASQALSPSSYQRLKSDGLEESGAPRYSRQPTIPRIPELEIGAQTDSKYDGEWI